VGHVRFWSLVRRFGHRGAFLLFLSVLDILYGYSLFSTSAPQRLLNLLLPWQAWGVIWMTIGGICVGFSMFRRDRLAFALEAALMSAWAGIMADTWISQGIARGWVSTAIFGSFSLAVLVVASWPEPPKLIRIERPRPDKIGQE
jgi:hypothetical protein